MEKEMENKEYGCWRKKVGRCTVDGPWWCDFCLSNEKIPLIDQVSLKIGDYLDG